MIIFLAWSLGLLVSGADPVNRVTIIPRGQALGVTFQRPEEDRYDYPEEYLRARIVGALGGRAAEVVVYGPRTTGAENDIDQATDLARRMVSRWGMSDELDMVALAPRESPFLGGGAPGGWDGQKPYSEETARKIDAEVQRIIRGSHDQARRLLSEHRDELDALARALLERETLDEEEILAVTGLTRAPRLEGGRRPISQAPDGNRDRQSQGEERYVESGSLKIIGLAGSLRRTSFHRGLIRAARELAPAGVTVEPYERLDETLSSTRTSRTSGIPPS